MKEGRKLAAILFTDIVGYSAIMQHDEKEAFKLRRQHRAVFEQQHQLHHGQIIQYYGDGTLSIFASAIEAVECTIAMQRLLQKGEPKVPVRMGLHIGDIVHTNTEVYGDGVNVTSRIENVGVAGAILLSDKINDELKNQQHISTHSLGNFQFKNITRPMEVFAVVHEDIYVPQKIDLQGKTSSSKRSIAVLPLVNRSSDDTNEYLADGMTEEIINALTQIKELKVTSRTSSFYFKNKQKPTREIGRELNVSTILEGSIRISPERMRISAQLIDVEEDYQFWSETFDRSIVDIFAVQDEISLIIADRLREQFGYFDIKEILVQDQQVSVENYKQYLKSRYHILKMSRSEIEKGITILRDVIDKQPNFTQGYLGIHLAYTLLGTMGYIPANTAFTKGKPFLDKALSLDVHLPECQLHLSWMSFLQEWDFEAAYKHLNNIFESRPFVDYYQTMASILTAEGKLAAAMNYIDTAFQLDPFSHINYHLKGYIYYLDEKYDQAIRHFEKSIQLKPDAQVSVMYLGQTLLLLGQAKEALTYFEKFSKKHDDLVRIGGITLAHATLKNKNEVKVGMQQLESALETELMERALNMLILCHAALGNDDKALELIEKAISHRLPMAVYLNVEPLLKPLHSYPRFKSLMKMVFSKES